MLCNRRRFLSAGAAAAIVGVSRVPAQPRIAIEQFPDPASGPGSGWTSVIFPDTQNYVKFAKNQPILDCMVEWVAAHARAWNIGLALHAGDHVEQNDITEGGGRGWGDQDSSQQWAAARRAMARLYDVLPTIVTTGNHDYGTRNAEDRRTRFNNHFGLTDNPLVADGHGGGIWLESATNSFGAKTLENAAYAIRPETGPPWLVIALEWAPRKVVVEWAKDMLNRPEYTKHRAILLTHSYLNDDNHRCGDHSRPGNAHWYATGKSGDTHDGEDLWNKLVKKGRQIDLVLCGHVMGRHVGYRCDPNEHGRRVHQMLFNAQGLGGGSDERGNGGDGWLRFLTLRTDARTLDVRSFSPYLLSQGRDPWRRGIDHSFTLQLDPI